MGSFRSYIIAWCNTLSVVFYKVLLVWFSIVLLIDILLTQITERRRKTIIPINANLLPVQICLGHVRTHNEAIHWLLSRISFLAVDVWYKNTKVNAQSHQSRLSCKYCSMLISSSVPEMGQRVPRDGSNVSERV